MAARVERTRAKAGTEGPGRGATGWRSHICIMWINQEVQLGRARQTTQPTVSAWEKKASKPLAVKTCGGSTGVRNSQPHRRVCWRDPQYPRTYTNPPNKESAAEGSNVFVYLEGSGLKWSEGQASSIVPSLTPHPHTAPQCSNVGGPALVNT